ncbi:MAG: amylosucrase [Lachnospiraceae bacterium]|nr:amylosucrase [Lachnospiraceae bacterium]
MTRKVEKSMDRLFEERWNRHKDEMRWLYMELYDNGDMFAELEEKMRSFAKERNTTLKKLDKQRETDKDWYKSGDMLGMMLYIDNFGGTFKGVQDKISYLEKSGVNYVHLMPFLDVTEGKSDGGYAVKDFRKPQKRFGTIEDLQALTTKCHEKGICVCSDFVMNHTSEDHEWAKRARAGEGEYMSRYFFYDNDYIPGEYEKTVPQVFPTTAPGNFTWLPERKHYVMTSFYPYQWDLNYKNPRVFNEMMYNFLFLANQGIDIVRLDAVPYIWKELGTTCRNLPKVHTIVRLMRMVSEVVCPGVLLLGEVVMAPEKVVPYFGSVEKPECHMLYNVTTMATTWHTVATRDVRLLKRQLDTIDELPKDYVFLNYLRCHDDIGWGLDYGFLSQLGMEEVPHKNYLNDFFLGKAGKSNSCGELYNYDPVTRDARFCGTTASLCGIETAFLKKDKTALKKAIDLDVMLHAYMFMQNGIPILYSGDEVAQLNDHSYREDPLKKEDSRYLHRGKMQWEKVEHLQDGDNVESEVYQRLRKLENIRKAHVAFCSDSAAWTVETYDQSTLCMGRYKDGEKILGVFNFSEEERMAWIQEADGLYEDLLTGKFIKPEGLTMQPYGFYWLKKI